MAARETSQDIDAAAADWVARMDRGPLGDEEKTAFDLWLRGDRRRPGAMLRAQAVSLRSESAVALGRGYDPADFDPGRPAGVSRRRMLAWGGGIAAAAGIGGAAVLLHAPVAYATERGEMRLVSLEDGSTILLNTDTLVKVRGRGRAREVVLVRGEAFFTVAKDAVRPFEVEVDGKRISTKAGAFRVHKLPAAAVDVLVSEGRVSASSDDRATAVFLEPHMRLAMGQTQAGGGVPVRVGADDVERDLAWREGKIAFQGEPLSEAAQAFSRYSDLRIVIEDAALAREPVTGLFAANDPAGFGIAVASIFDARVSRRGDMIVIAAH